MTTLEKVASILIAVALIGSIWASAVLMQQQMEKEKLTKPKPYGSIKP